jgi:hypothetical protein
MKTKALLMTIAMMSAALAGCTGSDGVAEIDDETLQQLFEDNIQDFMNNTTVTVNQEIHYHNNTTVDDSDNSVTTDNSVINNNGTGSDSQLQMFTVEWDWSDFPDSDMSDRIVLGTGSNNNSGNNNDNGSSSGNNGNSGDPALLYVLFYDNAVIEFRDIECAEWLYYDYYDHSDWEDWLRFNYGTNWNELSDDAYDLYYHFQYNDNDGYDAFEQCGYGESSSERIILYNIELGIGEAMSFHVNGQGVTTDINCADGYGTGLGNGTFTTYIGGQSECTVTGSTTVEYSMSYRWLYDDNGSTVDDPATGYHMREYYTYYNSQTPEAFAVYFTMHDVVVYDIDEV